MREGPLEQSHLAELHELALANGVPRFRTLRREELIEAILAAHPDQDDDAESEAPGVEVGKADQEDRVEQLLERRAGVLDLVPDGYGFLRAEGLSRSADDIYVSRSQVRALGLRSGDEIAGPARPPRRSDRYPSLTEIETVDGRPVDELAEDRPVFSRLTPIAPNERLMHQAEPSDRAVRMVDALAPLAKGQRCLIASPAGAGATSLLRDLARALARERALTSMVVLIDARPEEVTEWRLSVELPVHATDSGRSPEAHVRLAELALERAKRLVEQGRDAVILLDSITRLARAYRLLRPRFGRGGREGAPGDEEEEGEVIEPTAIRAVKRWFAIARSTEERGSLTILATLRVGSESAFEQLVWEALSDTATTQVRLDRGLATAGLFPPLDVARSRSYGAEAILSPEETDALRRLRTELVERPPAEAWELLDARVRETS